MSGTPPVTSPRAFEHHATGRCQPPQERLASGMRAGNERTLGKDPC